MLVVAIESRVSNFVGKFRSWALSIFILVVRVKNRGTVSELSPSYLYIGGCHRISRAQIRGKTSELGPSYFHIGDCNRIFRVQSSGNISE